MSIKSSYPYFDDYDSTKGFHKILFHPAKPVQARELTQMQSILQEQIKRHGDHMFKNGTMVLPGHMFYDGDVNYLKLETVYNQTNIESQLSSMVGKTIKGDINGISALVLHYDIKTATDSTTIYIKYTSAAGGINTFVSGETMTCPDIPLLTFKVSPVTNYTGSAAICHIGDGVYYVNGYFVGVAKQVVTVSKYNNTSSAVVGLDYIETAITENEDSSLYDNAFGFTNYGAPGAHRLQISLNLSVKPYSYTSSDVTNLKFIDILKVKDGAIEYLKDKTEYAEFEKLLARRTYDESGNYSVKPFKFAAYDYRNNDRGQWVTNTPYLAGDIVSNSSNYYIAMNTGYSSITAPVHTTGIVSDGVVNWNELTNKNGLLNKGKITMSSTVLNDHINASGNMLIETSAGKAYLKGFEVEFNALSKTLVPKARKTSQVNQTQIFAPAGTYIVVNNLIPGAGGLPNVNTNLTQTNILNMSGTIVGTAWIRAIEYSTGTPGTTTAEYKVFMFGINMLPGYNFGDNANSLSATGIFTATIKPTIIPQRISGTVNTPTQSSSTTLLGSSTYFTFDLKVGSRLFVQDSSTPHSIEITSVGPSDGSATFTIGPGAANPVGIGYGSILYYMYSPLVKLGDYIQPMPVSAINTLRSSTGAIDMQYVVYKSYPFTTAAGVTTQSYTLSGGETWMPTGHIVTRTTSTAAVINATYTINTPATTITIGNLSPSDSFVVLLAVKRTGAFAKEKSKTLLTKTIIINNVGTYASDNTTQLNTTAKYDSKVIGLTKADVTRIIKVTESGDAVSKTTYLATGETDITSYFTLDNGQRSEYYDIGTATTSRFTTRPIMITFEYYYHSSGDYFSVDSYSTVPKIMLDNVTINTNSYYLPDCLDFRVRIADSGANFDSASGASISDPLSSTQTMSTSYSYFLPRTDTLGIDESGELTYNVDGKFAAGMQLATVDVNAYTRSPITDVKFTDDQITSYTMKDIGALDSRLSNVEYYVALSQLEKQTINSTIKDQYGIEVTKNGFLVDQFTGHIASAVTDPDFKASMDLAAGECRALSTADGIILVEPIGTTNSARLSSGYALTGDMITLPYVEDPMISQSIASQAEFIQAYATLDFNGQMIIYPDADNYTLQVYDDAITASRAADINVTKETTSKVYGTMTYHAGGHDECDPFCHWHADQISNPAHETYSKSTSIASSSVTTLNKSYLTEDIATAPKLRARTIVMSMRKLKPSTSMNLFMSDNLMNDYYVPCTVLTISSGGKFIGSESDKLNDNQSARTTNNFNTQKNGFTSLARYWFGIWGSINAAYANYYDIIQRGEVITCAGGATAIVVAQETNTLGNVLYVINVKGTLSGAFTGSVSNSTGTILSVSSGTNTTTSLGSLYGALAIPGNKYLSGRNKIMVTDAITPNVSEASTFADAGYYSDGVIDTHVRHLNYDTQTTVTTTNNTETNVQYYQ